MHATLGYGMIAAFRTSTWRNTSASGVSNRPSYLSARIRKAPVKSSQGEEEKNLFSTIRSAQGIQALFMLRPGVSLLKTRRETNLVASGGILGSVSKTQIVCETDKIQHPEFLSKFANTKDL